MFKRVILPGLVGGLVLIVWNVLVNGIFGFNSRIEMKRIPNERLVYEVLKEHVTEPGRYACNPEVIPERGFPEDEPVFGVLYGGVGHEAAGRLMLLQLPIVFIAPIIVAWMLSVTADRILSRYLKKVLFVAAFGLFLALFVRLSDYGIGDYPINDALLLALHDLVLWTVIGVVMGRMIRPVREGES
jgi:hypothetical protein